MATVAGQRADTARSSTAAILGVVLSADASGPSRRIRDDARQSDPARESCGPAATVAPLGSDPGGGAGDRHAARKWPGRSGQRGHAQGADRRELGEQELLLPALVNEALAANDRAKYLMTLLQVARSTPTIPTWPRRTSGRSGSPAASRTPNWIPSSSGAARTARTRTASPRPVGSTTCSWRTSAK